MAIVDREEVPDHFDLVAIDGDIIHYRASWAAEKTIYHLYDPDGDFVETFTSAKDTVSYLEDIAEFFGEPTEDYKRVAEKVVDDVEHALNACDTIVEHIKRKVPSKEYKIYINGEDNYREHIAVTKGYKANRKDIAKPVHHEAVKEHLIKNHNAIVVNGNESDDAIGVCMYMGHLGKKKTCGISIDKDILNVPGIYYHFVDDEFHIVSEEEADKFLAVQILSGDPVDNIPNVGNLSKEFREEKGLTKRKGFGIKSAEKLLEGKNSKDEYFEVMKEAFQDACGGNWRDRLNENGKLVYIQREKGKIWDVNWYEE